jgi:hypothetical protein
MCIFAFLGPATAQLISDKPVAHVHASSGVIDGSLHPEMIPDSAAYRLYFVAVSPASDAGPDEKARELAHLRQIGLSDPDLDRLMFVLSDFKAQYSDMIAHYNEVAERDTEIGITPDRKSFLARRDVLVRMTRDRLQALLSPESVSRLDNHVQHEKRNMRVADEEAQ